MDRGDAQIAKSPAMLEATLVLCLRGTVLGSLWVDDNDMILGQVADDRTKKGFVKISAVVDTGRGKRLSRERDAVDSTEAQFSLKDRKDLPRRGEKIPSLREARGR